MHNPNDIPDPDPDNEQHNEPNTTSATLLEQLGDLLEDVENTERAKGTAAATQVVAIETARQFQEKIQNAPAAELAKTNSVRFVSEELCWRSFTTEVGLAMNVPDGTADRMITESYELSTFLPATLDALRLGRISYRHATTIVKHTAGLDDASKLLFEEAALPTAFEQPVLKFDRFARRLRERLNPIALEERHRTAFEKREFAVDPKQDGMSFVSLYVSAVDGVAIQDRIYAIAEKLHSIPGETRTVTQLRADVAVQILQEGDLFPSTTATEGAPAEVSGRGIGRFAGIKPTVMVTVPVLALVEAVNGQEPADHGPAELEGYGPIPMEQALELAGTATSFIRLLTHPETGTVLSVGRDRYKPPSDLARWITYRDETCRGPNCNRRAKDCDIDHNIAWQHGGSTAYDNLAAECRGTHLVKHSMLTDGTTGPDGKLTTKGEGWRIDHERDENGQSTGTLIWTTPTGRTYLSRPAVNLRPPPPPPPHEPPAEPFDWETGGVTPAPDDLTPFG